MKLKEAREIGKECGLLTDAECIVNIEIHAMSLFEYTKISSELKELMQDCIHNGVDYNTIMDEYNRKFNEHVSNNQ